MSAPAAGVDFDRNRLSVGEMIAGIAGLVLLIDLWFKWYGVEVEGPGGALGNLNIGVSANAWESFGLIDIILFLVALIAIGVAVMRALGNMPDMPYPPATIVAIAGAVALLLIIFRIIDSPVDTGGVEGVDATRKIGVWIGLLAAAAITYGGWRAMQETGASLGGPGARTSSTEPTVQSPAATPSAGTAGTSTGAPPAAPGGAAGGTPPPPPSGPPAADPPAGGPTPGLSGDPDTPGGTTPPGIPGSPHPDEPRNP